MKKLSILFVLIVANMAVALASIGATGSQEPEVLVADIASTAASTCTAGGPGSTQCSIQAGQSIDGGVSIGCSVTCNHEFYACCGVDCKCVSYIAAK